MSPFQPSKHRHEDLFDAAREEKELRGHLLQMLEEVAISTLQFNQSITRFVSFKSLLALRQFEAGAIILKCVFSISCPSVYVLRAYV